jgi:O-antigen/teichoic acid export membrane protein
MSSNNSYKQIKRGAILSYVYIAIQIISGLIYTPWMVKQIGMADYGLFALATSLITFVSLDFGLGTAITRYLSKYKAEGNKEAEEKFLGVAFKIFMILACIIFLVLFVMFFFIENIYAQLSPLEISKLRVVYVVFGLFTVVSFPFMPFKGILTSNERFGFLKCLDILKVLLITALMIAALLLGYGLYSLVLVNAFAGILKILIEYIYIKKRTDTSVDFKNTDKAMYKGLLVFSVWTTATVVAQRFILNITPTILGMFSGSVQIAIFSVGMKMEMYTYLLSNALGGLLLPKVSRLTLSNNDNKEEFNKLNVKVGRIQLFIVGIVFAGFLSMGKEFMLLWMGKGFIDSYYVTLLLIAPTIVTLTLPVANNALLALNKHKYIAVSSTITAIISVTLSMILSKYYGAIGAAISIFIGNFFGKLIYLNVIYHKIAKVNMFRFFKECQFKMIIPFFTTLLSGYALQHIYPVESMILFILKSIMLAIIYLLLSWFFYFNKYEKKLYFGMLRRTKEMS